MKKLLGIFACLSMVLVLNFGATGCTKKEEVKAKDTKDKKDGELAKKLDNAAKKIDEAAKKIDEAAKKVDEATQKAIDEAAKKLEDEAKKVKEGLKKIDEGAKKLIDDAKKTAEDGAKKVEDAAKKVGEALKKEPEKVDPAKILPPKLETSLPSIDAPPSKGAILHRYSPADLRRQELIPAIVSRNSRVG